MTTKPGYGLGLYSAGYHNLAQIYALVAKAAYASTQKQWDEAVRLLARAAKLENGMGYIEPPRMAMTLQPCLASVLVLSGDYVAAMKVSNDNLERFPRTMWAQRVSTAIDLASADMQGIQEVHRAAHDACMLIFGS